MGLQILTSASLSSASPRLPWLLRVTLLTSRLVQKGQENLGGYTPLSTKGEKLLRNARQTAFAAATCVHLLPGSRGSLTWIVGPVWSLKVWCKMLFLKEGFLDLKGLAYWMHFLFVLFCCHASRGLLIYRFSLLCLVRDLLLFCFLLFRFPLFAAVYKICYEGKPVQEMISCLQSHPQHI